MAGNTDSEYGAQLQENKLGGPVEYRPSAQGEGHLLKSEVGEADLRVETHGVRFRVYPSLIQEQVLKRWIGTQRYICNRKVEELDYQLTLKKLAKFSNRFEEPDET
jgi:hypothetical protein